MRIKLLHISIRLVPVCMLCMLLGILSACRNDSPFSPEEFDKDSDINVCFKISTGNEFNTRSVLPEEFGTQIENRINTEDFVILIFDDDTKTLLDILYNNGEVADKTSLQSLGMGEYVLNAKLSPSKYSLASRFSIVALANWNSLKESRSEIELIEGETELSTLMQQTYLINNSNAGADISEESWVPKDDTLIPMFGLLHASLKGYSSDIYNEGNPMDMGVVDLLRALVKIEVIDNSGGKDADILSISLDKRNTRGYLAPDLGIGDNTTQVESARIPSTVGVANPAGYTESLITFKKEGNKYYAYVPEFMLANAIADRPNINVTITYKGFVETRKIALTPHDPDGKPYIPASGLPNEWKELLRNHVYRFTIKSITADPYMLLTVDVLPWEGQHFELDFTDNIAMASDGALTFTPGTYASLYGQTGRVVLNDFPQAAVGTFGISEPKGARWSAYLIPTGGELDAIQFVVTDSDGKTTTASSISGIIDGKKATFKVAATKSAGNTANTAILQVIVTTAYGTSVPVNVLKGGQYGVDVENITFIQNPQ